MYKAFFGLSDAPFSIAPNPKYLFLSDRHKEALAHLTYGLGDGGGFVLLTGEVGTGKTTVARSLLQQLPENVNVASILNPSLTELELLATLCDELGIAYPAEPTLKQLTDLISAYLLDNHHAGRQTLLLIDEAQHLRAEVLEQLRLLTNLETDEQKLLQVILIGQPELQQLLKQQHLRQLAQRITARYHLMPLTVDEISAYILHRLAVAGRASALFTRAACNEVHRLSQGIPRVVNLLCERALLTAYSRQQTEIGPALVKEAAKDVLVIELPEPRGGNGWRLPALVSVLTAALGFSATYAALLSQPAPPTVVAATAPAPVAVSAPAATQVAPAVVLADYMHQAVLRQPAFSALMGLWGTTEGAGSNVCLSAERFGLRCFHGQGWDQLLRYNHPAVLELHDRGQRFYGVLVANNDDRLILQLATQRMAVSSQWLLEHWSGAFTLLWQPPQGFDQSLRLGDRGEAVLALDRLLNTAFDLPARQATTFDQDMDRKVRRFQQQQRLSVDGIAGSKTMLELQAVYGQRGPRLTMGEG